MGPFVRYTLLRLGVLAAVGGLLLLAGLRGPLWAAVSVAVAAALSYLLLARPRDAVLARWEAGRGTTDGSGGREPTDEEAEDARVDAARPPDPGPADARGRDRRG